MRSPKGFRSIVSIGTVAIGFCMALSTASVFAQTAYRAPGSKIVQLMTPLPVEKAHVTAGNKWLVVSVSQPYEPSIRELAAPKVSLAGRQYPLQPADWRTLTHITHIQFYSLDGKLQRVLLPPAGAHIGEFGWIRESGEAAQVVYSVRRKNGDTLHWYDAEKDVRYAIAAPGLRGVIGHLQVTRDGRHLAFSVSTNDSQYLWLADIQQNRARPVKGLALNHMLGSCAWTQGLPPLICRAKPVKQPSLPKAADGVVHPVIQHSPQRVASVPIYNDLLQSPRDEALLDHYLTSQVASIGVDGIITRLGEPGIYTRAAASPDGRYVLVDKISRPYSYQVPLENFPTQISIWDRSGKTIKMLSDRPLQEDVLKGKDWVAAGIREVEWRQDAPASVILVEALDGGNPEKQPSLNDRISLLNEPFDTPFTLAELEGRFVSLEWSHPDMALLRMRSELSNYERIWWLNPQDFTVKPKLLANDRGYSASSEQSGFVMIEHPSEDRSVLMRSADGRCLYDVKDNFGGHALMSVDLQAFGYSSIGTFVTKELWTRKSDGHSDAPPYFDRLVKFLGPDSGLIVISRESPQQRPNYFLHDIRTGQAVRQLTHFQNPDGWWAQVKRERIDSFERSPKGQVHVKAVAHLPPGYDQKRDGALPFVVWMKEEPQGQENSKRAYLSGAYQNHQLLLAAGYGVLEIPATRIWWYNGKFDEYVKRTVSEAEAALNAVIKSGVADSKRLGVGGEGSGALAAVTLLIHTDLFRAGIGVNGVYNRALFPEKSAGDSRWEMRETYEQILPLLTADKLNESLLLIHGMNESHITQSERLYSAVKGNGGSARYVQLPLEGRPYLAKESRQHAISEMISWLDSYVRKELR